MVVSTFYLIKYLLRCYNICIFMESEDSLIQFEVNVRLAIVYPHGHVSTLVEVNGGRCFWMDSPDIVFVPPMTPDEVIAALADRV
jgi:hypothetical protein